MADRLFEGPRRFCCIGRSVGPSAPPRLRGVRGATAPAFSSHQTAPDRHTQLSVCRRLAYEDYGSPKGASFPNGRPRFAHEDHPGFMADWPFGRPPRWLPPPGMLEAIAAEPAYKPYDHREPDWRRWWPGYVLGRPWPWRADADAGAPPEPAAEAAGARAETTRPEPRSGR